MPGIPPATREYEKCMDDLRKGGHAGKRAYDKARVAEAEASRGKIETLRMNLGDNRIPNEEKYEVSDGYRLVIQRVDGQRVFVYVGTHADVDRWLDLNRGQWPALGPGRVGKEDTQSKSDRELEALREKVARSEAEKNAEFEAIAALAKELAADKEKNKEQSEALERMRQELAAEADKQTRTFVEREQEVNVAQQEVERRWKEIAKRERLLAEKEQNLSEGNQQYRSQRAQSPSQVKAIGHIGEPALARAGNQRRSKVVRPVHLVLIAIAVLLLLPVPLAVLVLAPWEKDPGSTPAALKTPAPPLPTVISPVEAKDWEGKTATVRFAVRGRRDLDWALLLNSDRDFRSADNFTVVIRKGVGPKYAELGVSDWKAQFPLNTTIIVTGEVTKYPDKKSGRVSYQIVVEDPDQIRRE